MIAKMILALALAVTFALGCGGAQRGAESESESESASVAAEVQTAAELEAPATPPWVSRMAALANAIERQPAAADSILRANAMSRETFDSLLYEIAADAELSAAYESRRAQ